MLPALKYLSLADILMEVYPNKFKTIRAEIADHYSFKKRCSVICDRIRYEALGRKSPAAQSVATSNVTLTREQKLVAIGLLYTQRKLSSLAKDMANLFPVMDCNDGRSILRKVFGENFSPFVSTSTQEGTANSDVVVVLRRSMLPLAEVDNVAKHDHESPSVGSTEYRTYKTYRDY